ncbi:sugar-transfer associated ATP-grasp domain-containing protein [Paracoccus sp. NSM]|uniref:sugar-transfer associated ATP-grasp domain-containing protein n=1 Tax=Paracoccus sp. NSM TaxID=3457784 RepID=UPI00403666BE
MLDETRPDPTFKQRMDQRLSEWYQRKNPDPDPAVQARRLFLASLVNKSVMTGYIGGLGLPLPLVHAEAASLDQLDIAALPSRVVIKPNNGADSKGVILLDGEVNRMNGDRVAPADRARYVRETWTADKIVEKPGTRVIAEEFLQDYDPAFAIPRDFKVFAAKGRCGLIQVIDRNPEKKLRTNSFFTRDWSHIDRPIKTNYRMGPAYPRPADLEVLIAMAERISAEIEEFYRLDFYMTTRGPVFGEFTSYPSAGEAFTPYGDRLMCQMMDTVRPPIPAPAPIPAPRDDLAARFVEAVKAARLGLSETEMPGLENWRRRFHHVVYALNRRSRRHLLFRDKLAFDGMVRSAGMDAPQTLAVLEGGVVHDTVARDRTDPTTFLARHEGAFFIKDRHGASGEGAYAITALGGEFSLNDKPSTRDEIIALLQGLPYPVLIQRRLAQHERLSVLNPSSINGVRIVTMFGRTCRQAEMLATAIRIGAAGNVVDNLIGGGSFCAIDPASGGLQGTPRNNAGVPLSAEQRGLDTFEGYRVPHFREAARRCLLLHEIIGPAPETIGWDVAITPEGPVFLEGNMYWDPTLHSGAGDIAHMVVSRLMQPGFAYCWKA